MTAGLRTFLVTGGAGFFIQTNLVGIYTLRLEARCYWRALPALAR